MPDTKDYILFDCIYINYSEIYRDRKQISVWLAEGKNGEWLQWDMREFSGVMEISQTGL